MYTDDYMSAQNMYVKVYTSNDNAHELPSANYSHNEIILQAHNKICTCTAYTGSTVQRIVYIRCC